MIKSPDELRCVTDETIIDCTKPTVLLACDFSHRFKHLLTQRYNLLGPYPVLDADVLPKCVQTTQAVVTKSSVPIDRSLIEALPELSLVSFFGTGYESIDFEIAAARGLTVTHSPGANAASVADFAMGLVLACTRRILTADKYVRQGRWSGQSHVNLLGAKGLTGARLGIYGYGAVGRKIAARATAFEMEVGYHGPTPKNDVPHTYLPSLLALAEWSDILVIAARADASNRHIVDAQVLRALGPQGHIVNIARGSLIDSEALAICLEQGVIAGAGLDVFEHEPDVPETLGRAPNTILTPHIAFASNSAQETQENMVLANLAAFFADTPVLNPVPWPTSPMLG